MLKTFIVKPDPAAIRTEVLQGKSHTVIPVVALVEGVLHAANMDYAEFIPAESIRESTEKWNGRVVVVDHPRDSEGNFILANNPQVFDKEVIGTIFNASFKDRHKLMFEVWIDNNRVDSIKEERIQETFKKLNSGDPVEVSTGFVAMGIPIEGTFEGKKFSSVLFDLEPDHIAILSGDTKGACNWEMGCGAPRLNVNKEQLEAVLKGSGGLEKMPETEKSKIVAAARIFSEKISEDGFEKDVQERIVLDEEGFISKLSNKVMNMFLQGKKDAKKKDVVDFLIACNSCKFDEEDRKWLSELDEEKLQKLVPEEAADEPKEEKGGADQDDVAPKLESEPKSVTFDQVLATASPEIQSLIKRGLESGLEEKRILVEKLSANPRCEWSKEDLQKMEVDQLKKLAKLSDPVDYSGSFGIMNSEGPKESEYFAPDPPSLFEMMEKEKQSKTN